jgi:hypothetical protein
MKTLTITMITLFLSLASVRAQAAETSVVHRAAIDAALTPHLHATVTAGDSSEDPAGLAAGGHDPDNEFTVQGIEPGFSFRLNDVLEGFATWNFYYGAEEEWEDEFEEGFVKLPHLPGGLELRGGRLLNRFGDRNAHHLHAWETIDQHLVIARFLGDDGMLTDGADLTWRLPTPFTSALTVSYGDAPSHGHDHGHDHDHDESGFADDFVSANLLGKWNRDDFNQFAFSGSFAQGDNGFDDNTRLFGMGAHYTWRENGLEAGGRQLAWKNEFMVRDYDAGGGPAHEKEDQDEHEGEHEHEHEHEEEHTELQGDEEFGFYSSVVYSLTRQADAGLRIDYVAGIDELELQERVRFSPHLTWFPMQKRNLHLRLQYNYDELEEDGDAHSGWVQVQYSFGGKEVR